MIVVVQQIIFNFWQVNAGGGPRESLSSESLRSPQELLWGPTGCHPWGPGMVLTLRPSFQWVVPTVKDARTRLCLSNVGLLQQATFAFMVLKG